MPYYRSRPTIRKLDKRIRKIENEVELKHKDETFFVGPKEIYLLDLPKALEKSKMRQLFAACETLKGGKIVDARNKYRKLLFGAPRICVFTNDLPPMDMFSRDVWEIDTINADGQLVPYQIDTVDDDDIAMAIVEKAFKNVGEEMKPFKTSRPKKI